MTVDSDIAELTASIKKGLDAKGALSSIRAQLRAQVFGAMAISMPQPEQKPTLNPAAKVALALIEEFLRFHECSCTLSTAESEVSGWSERLPGGELASATGLAEGDAPLLVKLVSAQLPGLRAQPAERRAPPPQESRRQVAPTSPTAATRPAPAATRPATSPSSSPSARPAAQPATSPTSPSRRGEAAASLSSRPRGTLGGLAPLKGAGSGGRGAEEDFVQAERRRRERQQREEEEKAAKRRAEEEAEAAQLAQEEAARRREAEAAKARAAQEAKEREAKAERELAREAAARKAKVEAEMGGAGTRTSRGWAESIGPRTRAQQQPCLDLQGWGF